MVNSVAAELHVVMGEVRARTLKLVAHLGDPELEAVHSPIMSPLAWDLGHVAAYEDLWLNHRLAGRELLHPGLPKLFDLQSKESLVATLEAYLDNGCDTKLTAEALFLHRASLYYRLQRIEQLTGTSLKSGADRLALHSSLKLARLLGLHPARKRVNT